MIDFCTSARDLPPTLDDSTLVLLHHSARHGEDIKVGIEDSKICIKERPRRSLH